MSATLIMYLLRLAGAAALAMAAVGLWYTVFSISVVASGGVDQLSVEINAPHFHAAYYSMAVPCMVFYLTLAVCGFQFFRLNDRLRWLFVAVVALEFLLDYSVGRLWSHPTYGHSVAAATGVALGGLSVQFMSGFPLWGPTLVFLATRLRKSAT